MEMKIRSCTYVYDSCGDGQRQWIIPVTSWVSRNNVIYCDLYQYQYCSLLAAVAVSVSQLDSLLSRAGAGSKAVSPPGLSQLGGVGCHQTLYIHYCGGPCFILYSVHAGSNWNTTTGYTSIHYRVHHYVIVREIHFSWVERTAGSVVLTSEPPFRNTGDHVDWQLSVVFTHSSHW